MSGTMPGRIGIDMYNVVLPRLQTLASRRLSPISSGFSSRVQLVFLHLLEFCSIFHHADIFYPFSSLSVLFYLLNSAQTQQPVSVKLVSFSPPHVLSISPLYGVYKMTSIRASCTVHCLQRSERLTGDTPKVLHGSSYRALYPPTIPSSPQTTIIVQL